MSLSVQSQQWYPTSVQVTVLQARNLRVKGKNGTNDAYAIIQVAKDKFSTSVAEKSVAPSWKEEASFDLPLFHRSNADRCTLYVIVMHRALGGLDKLLGQAVINLVDQHENPARKKTDWYKLVEKSGKADKDRGEVLLDIQFMRNSMTASMFDLSMEDKPRSRLSKIKDKVRGKKKDVDSASAVVPASVNQVLTDSEGEEEDIPGSLRNKKSSKFKSLFGSKTNLNKGVSQSMSTLGTLPEKNSSLSGSQISGLNEESADGKSKFKFLGHKRNGSTDSKVSLGPFALLNRNKQSTPDPNNMCINGNHVYSKEQDPNSGSSLSLNGSAKGSVEDLRTNHGRNASTSSVDSFMGFGIPSYKPELVEDVKKQDGRLQELLQDQERKRQHEQEEKLRKLQDEEKTSKEELQRRRQEEEEQLRKKREEEGRKAEELKRQEESRVTERLTNLFGLGKKKDEAPPPAPKHLDLPASSNPFEEIPLSPESTNLSQNEGDTWRDGRTSFTPTQPISSFPARTAKVSAVKPRLTFVSESETNNPNLPDSPVSASTVSPNTYPPSKTLDMFSNLHSSMAPPKPQRTFSHDSTENLSDGEATTSLPGKKHKAPQPPGSTGDSFKNENHSPRNSAQVHSPTSEQRFSIPLPDYDALLPKKRHGVKSDARWEDIIAEVNQKKRDGKFRHSEEENVDRPFESTSDKYAVLKESVLSRHNQDQIENQEPSFVPSWRRHCTQPQVPAKPVILEALEHSSELGSEPGIQERSHAVDTPHDNIYSALKTSEKSVLRPLTHNQPIEKLASDQWPKPRERSQHQSQTNEKKILDFVSETTSQTLDVKTEKPVPAARSLKNLSSSLPVDGNSNEDAAELPLSKPRHIKKEKQDQPITLNYTSAPLDFTKTKSLWEKADPEEAKPSTLLVTETITISKEPSADVNRSPKNKMIEDDPLPNDKLFSQDPWTTGSQDSSTLAEKQIEDFTKTKRLWEKADVEETKPSSLNVTKSVTVAKDPFEYKTSTEKEMVEDYLVNNEKLISQDPPALVKKQIEDFTKTKRLWEKADFEETKPSSLNVTKSVTVAKDPFAFVKTSTEKKLIEDDPVHNDKLVSQDPSALVKKDFTKTKSLWEKADLEETKPSSLNVTKSVTVAKDPFAFVKTSTEKKLIEDDPVHNEKLVSQDSSALVKKQIEDFTKTKSLWEKGDSEETKPSSLNITQTFTVAKDHSIENKITEDDPFPNDKLFSKDPWAMGSQDPWATSSRDPWTAASLLQQNLFQDDLFSHNQTKAKTQQDLKLTTDDFDRAFGSTATKNVTDPFLPSKEDKMQSFEYKASKDGIEGNPQTHSSSSPSLKVYSQRKKLAPLPPKDVDKQDDDVELTVTSIGGANTKTSSRTSSSKRLDSFSASSESSDSTLGSKSMLYARVTPSEVQSTTSHSSRGNGVLSARRPHPVKPLSLNEIQPTSNIYIGKDFKTPTIRELAEKSKAVDSGPYTQLTQDELITLVVKQQAELGKKDDKIVELEEYIDKLLVRVIEEKPSILSALAFKC